MIIISRFILTTELYYTESQTIPQRIKYRGIMKKQKKKAACAQNKNFLTVMKN